MSNLELFLLGIVSLVVGSTSLALWWRFMWDGRRRPSELMGGFPDTKEMGRTFGFCAGALVFIGALFIVSSAWAACNPVRQSDPDGIDGAKPSDTLQSYPFAFDTLQVIETFKIPVGNSEEGASSSTERGYHLSYNIRGGADDFIPGGSFIKLLEEEWGAPAERTPNVVWEGVSLPGASARSVTVSISTQEIPYSDSVATGVRIDIVTGDGVDLLALNRNLREEIKDYFHDVLRRSNRQQ